jgi:shikimate kinase
MSSYLPFSERNLIITGYIGPNHPILARQIAEKLSMPYANVEQIIAERLDMQVNEIRDYFGETRLKSIEAEIVQETALRRGTVIRVSGRTLVNGDNLAILQTTGPVFCLTLSLDTMLHRLHVNMGTRYHDPKERALTVGELAREWRIQAYDGIQKIDTGDMSNDEIVNILVGLWRSLTVRAR